MPELHPKVLMDNAVQAAFRQAWQDSHPGPSGGHEEGGFVLKNPAGQMHVARWPKGAQNSIVIPSHPNCKIDDCDIIATFHTHPNTGSDFLQEPGITDRRAVQDDPDLKGTYYEGEYVISQQTIYLISPTGQVRDIGHTPETLFEA